MGNIYKPTYRRDYTGETISYVEDGVQKSIFVTPRDLPHDWNSRSAVVLGNGISRLDPTVKLIIDGNNRRVAEGYKLTYACNAAYRDTPADYYVIKNNIFFSDIPLADYNKMFTPNDHWLTYRDTNMLPGSYHMDAGASAAYLAAFDGAQKVFLFGFDGTDGVTSENIYADTFGYESAEYMEDFQKFNAFPSLLEAQTGAFFEQPVPFLGGQKARTDWRETALKIKATRVFKNDPIAEEIVNAELDLVLTKGKSVDSALADAHRLIQRRAQR